MIHKLLILALFVYVLAVQAHSQTNKAQQTPANAGPTQAAAQIVAQQSARKEGENHAERHVDADVRVVSTPAKDGYDKAIVWINLALAVIGVLGIGAAFCTLRKLERQTKAMEDSNRQNAEFFRTEKRPWVGILGNLSLRDRKSTKPGHFGFTLEYVVKNYGAAPAFNTVVRFGATVEGIDMNNYALVKSKVEESRKSGENIVEITGDLLLPGAEKTCTCEFSETRRAQKFVVTGCIVYRFADGTIHRTELSYWIDLNEGEKAEFHTLWFQAAD